MATPDQIPSDLTLEVGVNLSPDRFMAATRAFFGYVEEVCRAISDDNATKWVVCVREGSALIGMEPAPVIPIEVVRAVYAKAETGVTQLASGDIEGAALSEVAIRHLKTLSDISLADRTRTIPVRLWVRKKPTDIGREVSRTIEEDWQVAYNDYGTIEGRLEAIQDRGGLHLSVRDALLRQTVRCLVSEDLLNQAFENFRKRVEVSGLIRYRKNGIPVSIKVDSFEALPDDSTLPTLRDVRGVLRLNG